MFLTQGGPEFWSQLAEVLIACPNARLAFHDDYRTLRAGQDVLYDDEDGADQSTHQEAPPVPSLRLTALVSSTHRVFCCARFCVDVDDVWACN
jgi:hypothetical protein